jgi:hypothetical protein
LLYKEHQLHNYGQKQEKGSLVQPAAAADWLVIWQWQKWQKEALQKAGWQKSG